MPCPGPTHPALQTIGRLYTHDELQISEITRDPGIYNLLHLCTDPKTTKEKLDAGGNLDSSEYPIIARGVKSSSTHRHVEDSVIDLINNTREIHGSMEDQGYLDIPLIDF